MKWKTLPPLERVRELLQYDPITGIFKWRVDRGGCKAGDVAGTKGTSDYVNIYIEGRGYRAHILAWGLMTGEWPDYEIDHANRDKLDNRWLNLREATRSENNANTRRPRHNKSGLKGVSRYRAGESYGKPWQAGIRHNNKSIHIGHYATKEEAHAAYCAKGRELFGEYFRGA